MKIWLYDQETRQGGLTAATAACSFPRFARYAPECCLATFPEAG